MKTEETKEPTLEEEIVQDCPILFQMRYRPMNETCMCWGFECGEGWYEIIGKAARQMELLNDTYYPKYRVRIQADQIKEKYGGLRFYYSVVVDPNKFNVWIANKFQDIYDYFSNYNFNYALKKVVDVEPHDYDSTAEITEEEYKTFTAPDYVKASNAEYYEKDGKYFRVYHMRDYGKVHMEPTKHRLFWKIMKFADNMYHKFMYCSNKKDNSHIRNCVSVLDYLAEKIVHEAEKACSNTCEKCGRQIGTEWSPVCKTLGWITYICDTCAEQSNQEYIKNGKHWLGKNQLEKDA